MVIIIVLFLSLVIASSYTAVVVASNYSSSPVEIAKQIALSEEVPAPIPSPAPDPEPIQYLVI